MKKMPDSIKKKVAQYNNAILKSALIYDELINLVEKYGVDFEELVDNSETLASISNGEGIDDESLIDLERAFIEIVESNKLKN